MNKLILKEEYLNKREKIERALERFRGLDSKSQYLEFIFCILTPQSNAKKCWKAVQELSKIKVFERDKVAKLLKSKTRFHNGKSISIVKSKDSWKEVFPRLSEKDRKLLRNEIAEIVRGYGLKEASHFLRNIGKSDNKIAILDRHILKNLSELRVISEADSKIKNKNHYLEIEKKFIDFSEDIGIPIDHLDLLFWSNETGEIFK